MAHKALITLKRGGKYLPPGTVLEKLDAVEARGLELRGFIASIPEQPPAPPPARPAKPAGAALAAAIADAHAALAAEVKTGRVDAEDVFIKSGAASVPALERLLGFDITPAERNAGFAELNRRLGNAGS